MNPLRLKLKGFIGIRDGLGRDEIEIDLRHDGAALVALVGPNGMGKTTLLDNMHPYRLMPSRASGYSPASFSYFEETYGEALKELEWEYGGTVYRSIIVIKGAGKTKKQECYLQFANTEGELWAPVELPDKTVSDGKTSTYDRCVEHILGSPELFFTAAFACQGRKSLADYANSDIKALMSDLLGLDNILELGERAHQVNRGLRAQLEAIRGRKDRAAAVAEERSAAEADLEIATGREQSLAGERDTAKATAKAASQRLAEAQSAHAQAAQIERQRETLRTRITAATERRDSELTRIQQEFQVRRLERQKALTAATADRARAVEAAADAKARIAKNEALLARKDEIAEAGARVTTLDAEIAAAETAVSEADQKAKEKTVAATRVDMLRAEWRSLKNEHTANEARCKLVDEVPCQGTDLQGKCKLLAEANTAKANLPALAEALAKKQEAGAAAQQALVALGDPAPALATARETLKALREEQARVSKVAALQHGIDAAAGALETDRAALADAEAAQARAAASIEEIDAALRQLDVDLEARLTEARASFQQEIAALEAELAALPPVNTEELAAAEKALADAEAEVTRLENSLSAATAQVATLKERIANLDREAAALAGDVERARRLEDEIAHWTLLARALGRDGIVALCIDDAGPTLTALANDLLTACYGPRFTVSIETQRETAKGTLAEGFDIKVFDAQADTEKSISKVSGGERIWINEAIIRAIALYQAQASGRRYECLFSDETDGPLDPEKKRQLMRMKRKVLELGGYRREFFVSHNPDSQAEADAQINLEDYQATTTNSAARKAA